MCGIVGQIAFSADQGGSDAEGVVRQLMTLMARRGPDDEGVWSNGQCCVLGVCRLSVLDLSPAGHQPMRTSDSRYVIAYNGEIYNFGELRRALEQEGAQFRSSGDTEVVLHGLAHWGTKALARFNGMFALAIYDSIEGRLLLARDHAGIKPLYYMASAQGLAFASQYDQILAHPWARNLDASSDALALYLRLGYIPAPYALLRNTHMLEPGTWLEVTRDGEVRRGRFFDFPVYRAPDLRGDEAYEAVDAAVTAAVRRHLVSDVPIGTFLSGGIDSPLVTAKMRAVYNGTIRAFTVGTNGDHLDESPDAIAYAREIGVDHTVVHVTPDDSVRLLNDVVAACGEPFADHSIFPTVLVSGRARREVKVMLSGDGGDELFWGYADRFASVMAAITDRTHTSEAAAPRWDAKRLLAGGAQRNDPRWPSSLGDAYRLKHLTSEGWLQRIFPDLPAWPTDFSLFTYTGWKPDPTAQWLRWNEFMGFMTMVLLKVDRASMYHSLEVRVPLLDKEVVELATRVDWRSCLDVSRNIGKLPLRYSLAQRVRHQTWRKRGFSAPIAAWLRGPLRAVFEEAVLGRQELLGLAIDQKAVREIFDHHCSSRANYRRVLWTLLSLALWQDAHYRTRRVP
jgi:asparagine synthase (glutamine-hydrolysing)